MTGKTFLDVLEQLEKTTGLNDKIALIKASKDNDKFKTYLYLAMDDRITFGVSKLTEFKKEDLKFPPIEDIWIAFTDLCEKLITRKLTGGAAQKEVANLLMCCDAPRAKWYKKAIQKDLACIGIGGSSVNKALDEKLILDFNCSGAKSESSIDKLTYDADAQWKVNGFRTFFFTDAQGKVDRTPFSEEKLPIGRSGLPIANFAFLIKYIESIGLANKVFDGEVEVDDNLSEVQSLFGFDMGLTDSDFKGKSGKVGKGWADYQARRAEVQDIQDRAKFRIFEVLDRAEFEAEDVKDVYIVRRKYLENTVAPLLVSSRVQIVESETVHNKAELYAVAAKYIKLGKEGVVGKAHNGKYGFTKDNSQMKVKIKTEPIDCMIIGWEIAKTSYKTDGQPYPAMLGRLNVEYINNRGETKQSGVGTGKLLTRAFRLAFAADPDSFMRRIVVCTSQEFTADEGVMSCPRVEELRPLQDKIKL